MRYVVVIRRAGSSAIRDVAVETEEDGMDGMRRAVDDVRARYPGCKVIGFRVYRWNGWINEVRPVPFIVR